jgi:phage terminase large subunit-like protein
VFAFLATLRKQFPAPAVKIDKRTIAGPAFLYDPMFLSIEADRMLHDGFAMVEVPQTATHIVPASSTFFTLVNAGQLRHDGNPILTTHLAHVVPLARGHGWLLTTPKGSSRQIHGAKAAVMAVHQAQQAVPEPRMKAFAA